MATNLEILVDIINKKAKTEFAKVKQDILDVEKATIEASRSGANFGVGFVRSFNNIIERSSVFRDAVAKNINKIRNIAEEASDKIAEVWEQGASAREVIESKLSKRLEAELLKRNRAEEDINTKRAQIYEDTEIKIDSLLKILN